MEKRYPIAEMFLSPQGEGLFAGQLQFFIRFAGCSVGKKLTEEEKKKFVMMEDVESQRTGIPIVSNLHVYREKCCTALGTEFLCDTNFQTKEVLTVDEIIKRIPEGITTICLTGGEPLDHPLSTLLLRLSEVEHIRVHIETSGTVLLTKHAFPEYQKEDSLQEGGWLWLTISPKKGILPKMVEMADEIKLLVDEAFDIEKVPMMIFEHPLIFIQPINYEFEINKSNLNRCLELQKEFPNWRISSQSHKTWRVR